MTILGVFPLTCCPLRFIEAFKMGMLLVNYITEVSKMSEKDKEHVFTLLDAFIARTKLQGLV